MTERPALPDWPRLMSIDTAAAYFSLSVNTFRSLGIAPIEHGRRVLYDRRSLDIFADHMAGQPLTSGEAERAALDEERAFFADRERKRNG